MDHMAEKAWLHDLRNAVNSTCVALDVAKRALAVSDAERATTFLELAEQAGARSRQLLLHPGLDEEDMPGPEIR